MKKLMLLLAVLAFAGAATAQEAPAADPYEFILAKLAADEGRLDEALTRIDRVIEKNPNNNVLLFERAMMLLDAGRYDRAESELRALTQAQPDFYDAQRMLGRVLVERAGNDRAKLAAAVGPLRAAARLSPDDVSSGLTAAQILIQAQNLEEAAKVLAPLAERMTDHRAVNYMYAQVLTRIGRASEALPFLERAIAADPTYGPAVFEIVDLYARTGAWQKAADALAPIVESSPLNVDVQRQQAYFLLRAGQTEKARDSFKALVAADPKDTRSLFYLGESLNDLGNYAEAEQIFRPLLDKTPNDAELLSNYGVAQMGQQKWDEASKSFNAILGMSDSPDQTKVLARTQLAYIALQKGELDSAVESAKHVFIFRDAPNTQAVNVAMEALRRQKKYEEASALLQPLVAKYPNDAFLNARYVEMLARTGDKARAQTVATSQTKLGTRNVIATAEAYIQASDYPSAINVIQQGLREKPDEVDLMFQLGSVNERAGNRKAAADAFLKLLEKNPDHAPTLNYLGYMWAEDNMNLDRAQDMLTRALTQDPKNAAYIDSLGWVYFRKGDLAQAEKYLTDAAKMLPRDPTVHEHLGDVLARRGEKARALQSYRTALTLEPEPKTEESLKMKIAELEQQRPVSNP
ncbi:MAG TPA: tetratricopeptide repeat protein [Thermoanaerobaculia bacterium]